METAARRALAALSLVFVMAVWGGSVTITKAAVESVPPIMLALLRFALAAALLLPLAIARLRARSGSGAAVPLRAAASLGLTGVTLYYVGYNVGVAYSTASQAAMIQSAGPAMTAVLAFFTLGERPAARAIAGVVLSMIGVAVVLFTSKAEVGASRPLFGGVLLVAATVVWSLYTIQAKRLADRDPVVLTAYTAAAGVAFLVPAAIIEYALGARAALTTPGWVSVAYLGAISSAAGYLLYNRSLKVLSAGQVAAYINLIPVVTVVTAVAFLGERLTPGTLLGGALVLLGVWLTSRGGG